MIYVLAKDGYAQEGIRVVEFSSILEATEWISSQLVYVEGVGMRSSRMYRMIEGSEIPIRFNLLSEKKPDSF